MTPIGRLSYEGTEEVAVDGAELDGTFKRAAAVDATGREFRFLFALESSPRRATLERLVVKADEEYTAVDLAAAPKSPQSVGLPDIRPQVRLAVGRRPVRVSGYEEEA